MANKQAVLSDSDLPAATAAAAAEANRPVFIDTSLDTHLLMVLSRSDTVSDFKRKIEKEHTLCFTDIGQIVVQALKVKRKGQLYHLSDSMLVKDAFGGANKSWFLSVDASRVEKKHINSNNLLTCTGFVLADGVDLPLNHSPEQGTSDPNKRIEIPQEHIELKSDASRHDIFELHDMSVQEASQPDLAQKKKRKVDEIVGNGHTQEEEIDSGKDASKLAIISQHSSRDKERSENAAVDGLTAKPMDDNNLVTTNSSSIHSRKKRKKSKAKHDKVADGFPSSGKDVLGESYVVHASIDHKDSGKPNTASVPGGGEDGITPFELQQKHSDTIRVVGEQEPSAIEVRCTTAATEEETTSAVNKKEMSKDYCPIDVENNPPLAAKEPEELQTVIEASGHNDIRSGQAERADEQGALSKKNDFIRMQSKKLDSPCLDKTEIQAKAINVTADSVDENGTVGPAETDKKRKRTKKTKDLVGKVLTTSGRDDVQGTETNDSVEPIVTKNGKQPGDEAKNEQSNLSPTIGNESTFRAKENDDITENEVKNVHKAIENKEITGNVEEVPLKKNSRKKKKSLTKNLPVVQVEDQNVVHQIPTPPTVTKTEVVASSNTKKKAKVEKQIKDRLTGGKLESENFGVQDEPIPAESNSLSAKSAKAQSHSVDHRDKVSREEADFTDNLSNSSRANETNNQIEVSGVGNKSNITSSEVLSDKKTRAKKNVTNREANTPRAKKNVKKPDIHSVQTSSNVQSSLKPKENKQIEGRPLAGNSGIIPPQGSSLKEKSDESMAHSEKKLPKASKNAAKALPSDMSAKLNLTSNETLKRIVANVTGTNINSEKNTDPASLLDSRSERTRNITAQNATSNQRRSAAVSNRAVADLNVSNKNNNSVIVNGSEPRKKLIATPGSIFKDDSVASSEDEGADNSDASTKTPSDYSSDYSDGESNANLNSPQKGSLTLDRMKSVDRKNILKSCASSGKELSFDSIVRSSSRYKKAKMTASQLQQEDESQPVDFVPDSQAN